MALPALQLQPRSTQAERVPAALHAVERPGRALTPAAVTASLFGIEALVAWALLAASGATQVSVVGCVAAHAALLLGSAATGRIGDLRLFAATNFRWSRLAALAGSATLAGAIVASASGGAAWPAGRLAAVLGALLTGAVVGQVAAEALRRRLVARERCLVVGPAERRASFVSQLEHAGVRHLSAVAGVDLLGLRLGDGDGRLEQHVAALGIDRVVVLAGHDPAQEIEVARRARAAGAAVTVVQPVHAALGAGSIVERPGSVVLASAAPLRSTGAWTAAKRAFDVLAAGSALVLCAPLLAVLALAVRMTSPGPAFFRQDRVGRDGEVFTITKLRSMVVGAERLKPALAAANDAQGGLFKIVDDPRTTPFGRWLRRTSLDELPQLLDVLRGDMSLVGPRPLVPAEDALVEGVHRDRLRLRPGITGPWQVLGGARIPLPEMVELDHQYVSGWSLGRDLRLLLRTVPLVLRRRGL